MADLEAQIRLSIDRSKLLAPLNEAEQKARKIGGALVPTSVNTSTAGSAGSATGGAGNANRYFALQINLLSLQVRLQSRIYTAVVDVRKEVTRVLVAVGATAQKRAAQEAADKTQAKGEARAAGARGGGDSLGGKIGGGIDAGAAAGAATVGGIFKLVASANPYVIERFDRAVTDLQAVIGQQLIPVVNSWTAGVRRVADEIASLDPAQKQMIRRFGETATVMAVVAVALGVMKFALTAIQRHPLIALLTAVAGVAAYKHFKDQDEAESKAGVKGLGGPFERGGEKYNEILQRGLEIKQLEKRRESIGGVGDTVLKFHNRVGGHAETRESLAAQIAAKKAEQLTAVAEFNLGKRGVSRGEEGTAERREFERRLAEEKTRLAGPGDAANTINSIRGLIGAGIAGGFAGGFAGGGAAGIVPGIWRGVAGAIGGGAGQPIGRNNAGASIGAGFDPNAGVRGSIDQAFIELTDKFLKLGSAAGEPVDPAKQAAIKIAEILPDIAEKLGNLAPGGAGGGMRPGP